MSCFGTITFCEQPENAKKIGVRLTPLNYKEGQGYQVTIEKNIKSITADEWNTIEEILISHNILHIAKPKNLLMLPFKTIEIYNGDKVRGLLGATLLKYITKHKLVRGNPIYSKIGIIDGMINLTLDTILPLAEDATDITLFTKTPEAYRDITQQVYEEAKLYIKLVPPNKKMISEMDVIYDLFGEGDYLYFARPGVVYTFVKTPKEQFAHEGAIVWYDFDVRWERQEITAEIMEALLMSEGYTKGMLRKTINQFDIQINNVYNRLNC
ncbi:MAG: hypothetical protein ATN35_03565 [Epulopiscium sp. Nele67-Bin004]|nr:MAG: hypothetical protein ATN35_03565 [Epulopiscium sp. Nele67-Bin004]